MALVRLTTDTISKLDDGRAGAVIDAALRAAFVDLEDRGHDGAKRAVTIKIEIAKDGSSNIKVKVSCACSLPKYVTDNTMAKLAHVQTKAGAVPLLSFQESNGEDADQGTFNFQDQNQDK